MELSKLENCRQIYLDFLHLDSDGKALDFDSFKAVSILGQVAGILTMDLYDLIDAFQEADFESLESYLERLRNLLHCCEN